MDHHVIMKKYRMFLYGMIVAALGISMITKAELGTSPITSPSYVLTFIFPYSLGVFVLAVNSTLFLFECLVLGRSFKKIQLLQLPATLIFSACIDGWDVGAVILDSGVLCTEGSSASRRMCGPGTGGSAGGGARCTDSSGRRPRPRDITQEKLGFWHCKDML